MHANEDLIIISCGTCTFYYISVILCFIFLYVAYFIVIIYLVQYLVCNQHRVFIINKKYGWRDPCFFLRTYIPCSIFSTSPLLGV